MLRPLTLICAVALMVLSVSAGIPKQAMRLEDATTLVFTKNEMTTSRRSGAVPQLACVSGPCQYAPNSAMCKNIGFDGRDVTWKCEAELPKGVKFGPVHVSCEGYASKDDDLVLKGSCGLEYELVGAPRFETEEKDDLSFVERHTRSAALGYPKSWWSSWFGSTADNAAAGAKSAIHDANDRAKAAMHGAQDRARHGYDHAKDVGEGYLPAFTALIHSLFSISIKLIAFMLLMYFVYKFFCPTAAPVSQPPPVQRRGLARSIIGMVPFGGAAMSIFDAFNPTGPSPPSYHQATAPRPPPSQPQAKAFQAQQTYPQASAPAAEAAPGGYGFLHGALGGAAAGYLLGRRRAPEATATVPPAARTETVRNVYVNDNRPSTNPRYEAREVYNAPESPKTRETTTAFATTRRR